MILFYKHILFFSALFFLCTYSFSQKTDSIPFPANAVEYFEFSWPADDILCDSYPFSEGPLTFTVCRLKNSKKIVSFHELGAFCQGDSDFNNYFIFNLKGEAVYSNSMGIYAPAITTFYMRGTPDIEIAVPGEGEEEYKPIFREPEYKDSLTSDDIEKTIADYLKRSKDRLAFLKKMTFKNEEKDKIKEVKNLINDLESSIDSEIIWSDGGVFRKPKLIKWGESGELAKLNTKNVTVYEDFDIKSKVIYNFTQYAENLEVIKQAIIEEYYPGQITDWRYIRYTDPSTLKNIEGWIPTEFIMEEVFRE